MVLHDARHLIWDQIIVEAKKCRPFLDFVSSQEIALTKAKKKVATVQGEVNKRSTQVDKNAIEFLSSLSDDLVSKYGIQNRVAIICWATKVISKHRMLYTILAKIYIIDHKFKEVIKLFKPLVDRGVPFFWEEKGPLLSKNDNLEQLVSCISENNFETCNNPCQE